AALAHRSSLVSVDFDGRRGLAFGFDFSPNSTSTASARFLIASTSAPDSTTAGSAPFSSHSIGSPSSCVDGGRTVCRPVLLNSTSIPADLLLYFLVATGPLVRYSQCDRRLLSLPKIAGVGGRNRGAS